MASESRPGQPDSTTVNNPYCKPEFREFYNPRLSTLRIQPIGQSTIRSLWEGWDLPGRNPSPTNAWCGSFLTDRDHTFPGCLNHEKHSNGMDLVRIKHPHSCRGRSCPICFLRWVDREAVKIVDRLDASLAYVQSRVIAHYVISVPRRYYRKDPETLKRLAIKWARYAGVETASVIIHIWRQNEDVYDKKGRLIHRADPNIPYGDWFFSPHFHLLGYGWIDKKIMTGYDLTLPDGRIKKIPGFFKKSRGWVLKKEPKRKTDVGTAWYLLTHCGVHPKHKSVSWFGVARTIRVPEREDPAEKCPECGEPMSPVYVKPTLDYYEKKTSFELGDNWVPPGLLKYHLPYSRSRHCNDPNRQDFIPAMEEFGY